jgi:hypothetical protein
MSPSTLRKSVVDLTIGDFERFPVWEFALDEEGEEGQDETTVRPLPLSSDLDPSAGMFVVRARFRLADATEMAGHLTPPVQGDRSLGTLQPVIITAEGQVLFWWGSIEPPRSDIAASYRRLGKTLPRQVFPLEFSSDVPLIDGPLHGQLPGFLVLEDWQSGRTRIVT